MEITITEYGKPSVYDTFPYIESEVRIESEARTPGLLSPQLVYIITEVSIFGQISGTKFIIASGLRTLPISSTRKPLVLHYYTQGVLVGMRSRYQS